MPNGWEIIQMNEMLIPLGIACSCIWLLRVWRQCAASWWPSRRTTSCTRDTRDGIPCWKPAGWLPRWSTLGLKMILQLFSFSADRANKWVILFENLKLLLSSSMYIDCFFPGVQRAGPTDVTRRCGRADVLLSGVLRREGQPRRGLVLPWLILVSNPSAELVKPMTY